MITTTNISTGTTTIDFGSNLRIGYKVHGSSDSFTYLTYHPLYTDLPYTYALPSGTFDIEYAQICPSCSLPTYSTPIQITITVP